MASGRSVLRREDDAQLLALHLGDVARGLSQVENHPGLALVINHAGRLQRPQIKALGLAAELRMGALKIEHQPNRIAQGECGGRGGQGLRKAEFHHGRVSLALRLKALQGIGCTGRSGWHGEGRGRGRRGSAAGCAQRHGGRGRCPRIALKGRQHRPRHLGHAELRGQLRPVLHAAHGVVALLAQRVALIFGAHHDRPQEHHQIGLLRRARIGAEQRAQPGNVAQARNLAVVLAHVVLHQPPEHDGLAVVDQHGGLDGAFVGDDARRVGGAGNARHLLIDIHLDRAARGNLRPHFQGQADVLALDGLERRDGGARSGLRILAGDEGHVLADNDLGLFVVEGHQVGRGKNIGAVLRLQKVRQQTQRGHARHVVQNADVQAIGDGQRTAGERRCRRTAAAGNGRLQIDDVRAAGAVIAAADDGILIARAAGDGLPLNTELRRLVGVDLGDQRLDINLRPAHVEPLDHPAQLHVNRLRRVDDEGIERVVGINRAALRQGYRRVAAGGGEFRRLAQPRAGGAGRPIRR